jgi:ferredoxin
MKIGIIYMTGTGTTAAFAEHIAQELFNQGHVVHVERFNTFPIEELANYDIIGFGCPTYSYGAPPIFLDFLKTINPLSKPFFLFGTCGGSPGNLLSDMNEILTPKYGPLLDSTIGLGNNNIRAWRPQEGKPSLNDGLDKDEILKAVQLARRLPKDYQQIWELKQQASKKIKRSMGWAIWTYFFTRPWQMRTIEGKKQVDLQKCTTCGLCATKICPSGAITFDSTKHPVFNQKKCIGCSGCVNICPVLAIYTSKNKFKQPYSLYRSNILSPKIDFK